MRVACGEEKHAKVLKFGMRQHGSHQRFRDPAASKLGKDEHIHQIREHRTVRDDPRERNLPAGHVDTETQRIANRSFDDAAAPTFSPVGRLEKAMNEIDIEPRGIR